jgi:hypothetical protein
MVGHRHPRLVAVLPEYEPVKQIERNGFVVLTRLKSVVIGRTIDCVNDSAFGPLKRVALSIEDHFIQTGDRVELVRQ